MGFGLNLGIPDPRQWKKQQVSKAVIDEERVSLSFIKGNMLLERAVGKTAAYSRTFQLQRKFPTSAKISNFARYFLTQTKTFQL